MTILSSMETMGHEQVAFFSDPDTGLRAIIAVHDTTLGPALGGCRFWDYPSEEAALFDVLRLSRGMTYKSAVAGLKLGGGKSVILGDVKRLKTPKLLEAFGRCVERMGGRYITAEDMNMGAEDIVTISHTTQFAAGKPQEMKGGSGNPSPFTALGVLCGIEAAVKHRLGKDSLSGLHIAMQGCGAVGQHLAGLLHEKGVRLSVSDLSSAATQKMAAEYGARVVPLDEIHRVEADVYAPCAMGAILNPTTISELQVPIVAGAANNQLLEEKRDGKMLQDRSILWAPDFVINAGGVINVYHELIGYNEAASRKEVVGIRETLRQLFLKAEKEHCTTLEASIRMGDEILAAARVK
jgi:leucine dehydrogenase